MSSKTIGNFIEYNKVLLMALMLLIKPVHIWTVAYLMYTIERKIAN